MVDVKEVAGVGFRALVDSALLCPNQEEVVCKRIKPHCRARACMHMYVRAWGVGAESGKEHTNRTPGTDKSWPIMYIVSFLGPQMEGGT